MGRKTLLAEVEERNRETQSYALFARRSDGQTDGVVWKVIMRCHVRWDDMVVLVKVGQLYHHGVSEATIVGGVFHFLGKDVTGIDFSRDVSNVGITSGVDLADPGFA